jgi:hypothetical protein
MGGFISFTATSVSAAATHVISTTLIDSTPNIYSRYGSHWLYGVTDGNPDTLAGEQRQVTQNGLDPATGTLYVSRAFSSTPASGAGWELYARIPAVKDVASGRDGYKEIINEALRAMAVHDWIDVAGVTGQTKYALDLATYPWLREDGRIIAVGRPTPNAADLETIDPQDWEVIMNGEVATLQLPAAYATGETFKLEVMRPANSRLRQSGTWTDQTSLSAGLSLDADEAIPPILDVVTVARELCYEELSRNVPEAETRLWLGKAEQAGRIANTLKWDYHGRHQRPRGMRFAGSTMAGL